MAPYPALAGWIVAGARMIATVAAKISGAPRIIVCPLSPGFVERSVRLAVAYPLAHLALTLGVLLAIGHRVEFRRSALRPFAAAPPGAGFGLRDRAALPSGCAKDDLAFFAPADLQRDVISLGLRLLVRAEAML